jgi:hypothetical protein
MSVRVRSYVVMVATVVVALAYTLIGRGWSDVAFYAGLAGLIAVVVIVGNLWTELGPDGAFRRPSHG